MAPPIADLLEERHQTHGEYAVTARIAIRLKEVVRGECTLRSAAGRPALSHGQQEALDLICTKIARIISGDPECEEHWLDIVGYAELGKPPKL